MLNTPLVGRADISHLSVYNGRQGGGTPSNNLPETAKPDGAYWKDGRKPVFENRGSVDMLHPNEVKT